MDKNLPPKAHPSRRAWRSGASCAGCARPVARVCSNSSRPWRSRVSGWSCCHAGQRTACCSSGAMPWWLPRPKPSGRSSLDQDHRMTAAPSVLRFGDF